MLSDEVKDKKILYNDIIKSSGDGFPKGIIVNVLKHKIEAQEALIKEMLDVIKITVDNIDYIYEYSDYKDVIKCPICHNEVEIIYSNGNRVTSANKIIHEKECLIEYLKAKELIKE
jgi:hypothetical protein